MDSQEETIRKGVNRFIRDLDDRDVPVALGMAPAIDRDKVS